MHGVDKNRLTWCDECGNALHKECFDQCTLVICFQYIDHLLIGGLVVGARTSGKNLTCVWCRAKWVLPTTGAGAAGGSMTSEGYMNLGNVAGVDNVRDTSSCEHCHFIGREMSTADLLQITMARGRDSDFMGIRNIGEQWRDYGRALVRPLSRCICGS